MDEGAYSILPKGGQYLGIVISNGDLKLTGRPTPVISASEARLYLDVLEAIKTLRIGRMPRQKGCHTKAASP